MKLAQFKTKSTPAARAGILIDWGVCDVAELARAIKLSGQETPNWLLETSSTLEIISRGPGGIAEVAKLLSRYQSSSTRTAVVAYQIDQIEFLPAVYPSK